MERWRTAFHKSGFYPGAHAYQVSSLGRVRRNGREVKARINKRGYAVVDLAGRTFNLHRVVLLTFRGLPAPHLEANHKNLVRHDARLRNLEWLTHLDNIRHYRRHAARKRSVDFRQEAAA